jgi:radical SAM protein with 4Fe4S-binding SPASM domain
MLRVLDPSMELRREGDRIVLFRRTWKGSFPKFPVHPVCAVLLALLDGQRTEQDIAGVLAEVFSFAPEKAAKVTALTMRKFERFLIDAARLAAREPAAYDPLDFVIPAQPQRTFPRETVPQYIWWRVTRYCNRRCKYCCVAAKHAEWAPDAAISFDRLREIFTEGADIGVRGVSLSGGEPFIRPDMVDLVELLLGLGYEVDIDTKFALSDEQIGRLAAAGLPLIHVSLDSPYAETANYLVGDKTYFDAITRSIRSLIAHGIRVTVTAVLTERNARELPEHVAFLADMGVELLTLNTFSRYYGQCRYVKAFELSPESRSFLGTALPALRESYDGRIDLAFDRNFNFAAADAGECTHAASEGPQSGPPLNCDLGIRVLRMLPDGRVSRCDQWWHEEEVVFGDLRTQSLWEAWSSDALHDMIYPRRALFAGTACGECSLFDTCSSTGRCLFAAQEAHGTVYAPDNHCALRAAS